MNNKELQAETEAQQSADMKAGTDAATVTDVQVTSSSQTIAKPAVRRSVDCPMCLFSSGIVADGKGTKCNTCGGVGAISKTSYNKLVDELGDIVGTRCA